MSSVAPQVVPGIPDRSPDVFETFSGLWYTFLFIFTWPIYLFHEVAHAIAATALGVGVVGAGVCAKPLGRIWRIPIIKISGAFVLHEGAEDRAKSLAITLAPLAFIPLGLIVPGEFIGLFLVVVGLTGVSDILQLLGVFEFQYHRDRSQPIFLLGEPDHWQLSLESFQEASES